MIETFETELVHSNGSAVLVVRGEIDLASAPMFRSAIEQTMGLGPSVVADLAGVTFMDSSGLNVLVALNTQGVPICLRNPSPQVNRLLAITGLQRLIGPGRGVDAGGAHDTVAVTGTTSDP